MHVRKTVGISCCLILAAGCTICQDPYYDCGPVWSRGRCQNCDPDYRSGSVLNRHAPGTVVAQDAPRTGKPARTAADGSLESKSRPRTATVAQQPLPKRSPAARQAAEASAGGDAAPRTLPPKTPPSGTVAAPAGTKEGDTRVLSITDRRVDEAQPAAKALAAGRKLAPRTAEQPSQYLGGWRAVAPRQDTPETASQPREVER